MDVCSEKRLRLRSRKLFFALVFAALFALAGLSVLQQGANAQGGGTVPGTIPPPLLNTLTVIHAAPFDADVADTAVDICTDAGEPIEELTGLTYLQSVNLTLLAGTYDWKVTAPGSGCATELLDIPPFVLNNGSVTLLLIVGDGTNQPLDSLIVRAVAGGPTIYLPMVFRNDEAP